MRYRLRTLLIVLAIGPMVLAWIWSGITAEVPEQQASQTLLIDASFDLEGWEYRRIDPPTLTGWRK
jgi:hypothetical protein